MLRNDEELRGPSRKNKGGAYSRKGAAGDEEFVLQYFRYTLQAVDKKKIPETSRGILNVDKMTEHDQE